MAQTKPLSEMSKEELTAELDGSYEAAENTGNYRTAIWQYSKCLVLIGMLQLKNRE